MDQGPRMLSVYGDAVHRPIAPSTVWYGAWAMQHTPLEWYTSYAHLDPRPIGSWSTEHMLWTSAL